MSDSISTGGRSPGFPFINLGKAVERLTTMYDFAKRSQVKLEPLYKHWELSPKSTNSKKTIAAMKYFGLIEDSGRGDDRLVSVSQRGLRILLEHEGSERKAQEIKDAALSPAMYKYLWEKYADDMPHDDAIKSDLIFNTGFNESSVGGFLNDYKKTITYALLGSSDRISHENDQENDRNDAPKDIPDVGDTIQWTSSGVDQLNPPKKVIALQDDWIFVEGSNSGIPMSEVNIIEKAQTVSKLEPIIPPILTNPSIIRPPSNLGLEGESVAILDEEQVFLSSALSKNEDNPVSFRLLVKGDMGVNEIGKLIKLLEAQKMILED